MVAPPAGTKAFEKCLGYGVDGNGLYVFFGFEFADKTQVHVEANHLSLGNVVNYLEAIAKEAQRRRLQVDPNTGDLEARGTPYSPVRKMDFEVDLTGDSTALLCTTHSGIRHELQLDLTLLEGLHQQLPSLMEEMKRRKAEHQKQH
jgi:hypothetical protein